ncbi:MAG: dipeptidase PepE [Myxococcota bacterium]
MHLLLASSSRIAPSGSRTAPSGSGIPEVLAYLGDAMSAHFPRSGRVAFIGFAKRDPAEYLEAVRPGFERVGLDLVDPGASLDGVDGVYVGGGNTFLLVKRLYETGWMARLRAAVGEGLPYMGASAGSNIAAPTLCTTNDMPIVQPPSFDALGFVPFQINPHYLDPDPHDTHQGETRVERIAEYHEHNQRTVVGLREGSWLTLHAGALRLEGDRMARIFRPDGAEEVPPGDLSALLRP